MNTVSKSSEPQMDREALAANRAQALLSKDLVTIDTKAPVELDLEALPRRDPGPDVLTPLFMRIGIEPVNTIAS